MSLKICVVTPVMNKFGGAHLSMLTLLDYFKKQGAEVKVIFPEECDYTSDLAKIGIESIVVPFERWILLPWERGQEKEDKAIRLFRSAIEGARQIKNWNPDVIYTNTAVVNVGALMALILNKPHVWHLRESLKFQKNWQTLYSYPESAEFICTNSNIVIANSTPLIEEFKEYLLPSKARVVHNFVEVKLPSLEEVDNDKKVDVIVPFYNDPDTIRCLESVKKHWNDKITKVYVISDCGPDQELNTKVEAWAKQNSDKFEFESTDKNGGYVYACNWGMKKSQNDVIILTTDTIVTHGWADKMFQVAYQEEKIGTVTPMSNGIGVFSIPIPEYNTDENPDLTNKILERLSPQEYVEVFTMHGFCSYIKRELINTIGMYDYEKYKFGYGEENDFSMRARKAGYKAVLACRAYVLHEGAKSFGSERKKKLIAENRKILDKDFPEYTSLWAEYMKQNPLESIRNIVKLYKEYPELLEENVYKFPIVGTIEARKGHIDAIKAVEILNKQGYNAHLLIIGQVAEKEYYDMCMDYVKTHSLEDKVHVMGTLEPPFTVMQDCDIYLMSSTMESFGRVTAEAMLLGKPVIGTDRGGTLELVKDGETGFLYPSGDFELLAKKIKILLDDKKMMQKFGEAGYIHINNLTSLEKFGGGVYSILAELQGHTFSQTLANTISKWLYKDVLDKNLIMGTMNHAKYKLRSTFLKDGWQLFKRALNKLKQ